MQQPSAWPSPGRTKMKSNSLAALVQVIYAVPRNSLAIHVAKTLRLRDNFPRVGMRLSGRLGVDTLAQQRIFLTEAGAKFKARVCKAIQCADEEAVTNRTDQSPIGMNALHELGADSNSSVARPQRALVSEKLPASKAGGVIFCSGSSQLSNWRGCQRPRGVFQWRHAAHGGRAVLGRRPDVRALLTAVVINAGIPHQDGRSQCLTRRARVGQWRHVAQNRDTVLGRRPDVRAMLTTVVVHGCVAAGTLKQDGRGRRVTRRALIGCHVVPPEAGCLGEERPLIAEGSER